MKLIDRLKLDLLGYIRRGDQVTFRCPKHGMKTRRLSGYTDMFGAHSMIFSDGTYVDCLDCLRESGRLPKVEREIPA